MEEALKNRVILILTVLTVILLMTSLHSCRLAQRHEKGRTQELELRFNSEEKLNKVTQERDKLQAQLNDSLRAGEAEKVAHQAVQKELEQLQATVDSTKDELQKMTQLKEKLEDDLKDALMTAKTPVKPKK